MNFKNSTGLCDFFSGFFTLTTQNCSDHRLDCSNFPTFFNPANRYADTTSSNHPLCQIFLQWNKGIQFGSIIAAVYISQNITNEFNIKYDKLENVILK